MKEFWNVNIGNTKIVTRFLWKPTRIKRKVKWMIFANIKQTCVYNVEMPNEFYWVNDEFVDNYNKEKIIDIKTNFLIGLCVGSLAIALIFIVAYGGIIWYLYNPNFCVNMIKKMITSSTIIIMITIIGMFFWGKGIIKKIVKHEKN